MEVFVSIVSLFVIGSVIGWGIEVLFRRIFSAKKWINPGFLVGPYLPIYGFGTVALYGLSNINLDVTPFLIEHHWLVIIIKILLIAIVMVLVEFIAGLIFIKGMKIKLWDYSNQPGNIMGIICPLFSFIWLAVGALYYFFINPYLVKGIAFLSGHPIYYFFIGAIYGAIIVDACYSFHLANSIRKFAKEKGITIKIDHFRQSVRNRFDNLKSDIKDKMKKKPNYIFPLRSDKDISELLDEYQKNDYIYEQGRKNGPKDDLEDKN